MTDESTVSLGYQELEDHNKLMKLIRNLIDEIDKLQFQYETGGITAHNESDTAHADIRQHLKNVQKYIDSLTNDKLVPIDKDRLISICKNAWTEN